MTIVFTLTNSNDVDQLIESLLLAGVAVAKENDNIIVECARASTVERVFRIHGHALEKNYTFLEDALSKLQTKYLKEFIRFESETDEQQDTKIEDAVGRQKLINFIQRKIREARKLRNKRRSQHARDELTGKVRAFEEILRRLKK